MDVMAVPYLIFWPIVFGLILFFLRSQPKVAQWANILFHLPWLFLLFKTWGVFQSVENVGFFPVVFQFPWLEGFKSQFLLGLDGLNLPLIFLNVFLSFCLSFYSLNKAKLGGAYLGLFAWLNAASIGSLLAADALLFYLFWEFMLIPMFFIIGIWGSKKRVYASLKFFAFTMAGSLFMLAAILYLWSQSNVESLSWHHIAQYVAMLGSGGAATFLFFSFVVAFFVQIPAWPLHVWLPDAHTEAPTGASVILAGVLLKLGVYGIARWGLALFPIVAAQPYVAKLMMSLALVGIILGSFAALRQSDIKRCIAYSSVAHLGFILMGLFSFQLAGFQGAMFQNIAHGLSTGALFLIFGIIYDRTHTREIADYQGLAIVAPKLSVFFVLAVMASIGLPGLPGFVGEFLILNGAFVYTPVVAVLATSGILLGAYYMLRIVRSVVFGERGGCLAKQEVSLSWSEWASVLPFVFMMIVLGVFGQFVVSLSSAAAASILLPITSALQNFGGQ